MRRTPQSTKSSKLPVARGLVKLNYRRDLHVSVGDRLAQRPVSGGDTRKDPRGLAVERENATGKVFTEHGSSGRKEGVTSPALGRELDAVKNFRFHDHGGEQFDCRTVR